MVSRELPWPDLGCFTPPQPIPKDDSQQWEGESGPGLWDWGKAGMGLVGTVYLRETLLLWGFKEPQEESEVPSICLCQVLQVTSSR